MHGGHVPLVDVDPDAEGAGVGERDDRRGGTVEYDAFAGLFVASQHDPADRRADDGLGQHGAGLGQCGSSQGHVRLGSRQFVGSGLGVDGSETLGRLHLTCRGDAPVALGAIQIVSRNHAGLEQPSIAFDLDARVVQGGVGLGRHRRRLTTLLRPGAVGQPKALGLGHLEPRIRRGDACLDVLALEAGHHLPGRDDIAFIDEHRGQLARQLGRDLDFLGRGLDTAGPRDGPVRRPGRGRRQRRRGCPTSGAAEDGHAGQAHQEQQ